MGWGTWLLAVLHTDRVWLPGHAMYVVERERNLSSVLNVFAWYTILCILYYIKMHIATFIQRGSGNQARDNNDMPCAAGTERRVTFFSFECLWSATNLLRYCWFVKLLHTSYHHSSYIYIHISFPARSKMPTLGPPLQSTPLLAPLSIGLDIFLALPTFEWEVSTQHSKITLLLTHTYDNIEVI